ncbi:PQQ-binding-like beta-propeller repeat protein [Streptomyces sp. NBC_00887]|uniref:outer membrane protein assembly factor BamB family protein n=1 Tax=Streptomyces sp. NBC_00887 TaxID=2975859 RepID=UPI003869A0CF|nr:PQQ-binding-like beta-propeller repeat protein [Streptomyces sp. NBC_00887]
MTQPPGQQPPQGGFGAPYDPSPGTPPSASPPGYGYPPAAGAPGGRPGPYGQQPGPYAQQPGSYGAGPGPYAQQPGPYAQQPGPYAQQPGPHPQPPGQGPGGSGSGRGPFKGRPAPVIGAVLAVLLLVGGGVWFATSGDGGSGKKHVSGGGDAKPSGSPTTGKEDGRSDAPTAAGLNARRKPGEAKVLWIRESGIDLPQYGDEQYGPWFAGDTVVKAIFRSVSGYSVADGSEKWTLKLPTDLCAAPTLPTADGKIVVGIEGNVSEQEAECSVLQMIDLRTGKAGWKKTVDRTDIQDGLSHVAMSVNGDTVTFGRTSNTDAFRISDGKKLFGKREGVCQPFAYTSGPRMIGAVSCQAEPVDPVRQQVQEVDPATGAAKWTYEVKAGWQVAHVYSSSPLVISIKKDEQWAVVVLNEDGTYRSQLVGRTENYTARCSEESVESGSNLDGCVGAAADEERLYLSTESLSTAKAMTNKVVAFDLATGRTVWQAPAPDNQVMWPLRMEGTDVLIHVRASYSKGGGIALIAPTGGAPRMLLKHPASGAPTESLIFAPKAACAGGRSFLLPGRISSDEDEEEKAQTALMVFGK